MPIAEAERQAVLRLPEGHVAERQRLMRRPRLLAAEALSLWGCLHGTLNVHDDSTLP